ncbi:hypothetical protein EJK17_09085 [Lactobacillus xujianguonis]|uniref:Uncharacterized protein n=1 Tax=Lactobacillus xujianguonis TaxID=2495899 RepID=A0A437STE8_9LACO|nr:hypothetical protein [Lactobacillus xujianguonis]RVU70175.1 hypothetical protein EJK17_09085 [Lactobacillus xujianguonis]
MSKENKKRPEMDDEQFIHDAKYFAAVEAFDKYGKDKPSDADIARIKMTWYVHFNGQYKAVFRVKGDDARLIDVTTSEGNEAYAAVFHTYVYNKDEKYR